MARRSTEAWWREQYGPPCKPRRATVIIGGHSFMIDERTVPAWHAFEDVRARHDYTINPPYPEGDSGTYNCRHIGNDSSRPWSVHAWAGAGDFNWRDNPDGPRLVTDMPQELRDDLMALRTKRTGAPVFRWGGDWDRDPRTDHSYYDAMHWEIAASPAELAEGIKLPARPSQEDIIMDAVVELLAVAYDRVRGTGVGKSHYDPRKKDPNGWRHWMEQMLRREPVKVLREAEGLLAHEAGL